MLALLTAMSAAAAVSNHARQQVNSPGINRMLHQDKSPMAFMMPDVPWYDSGAIGWAGTNPPQDGDSDLGHGLIEQVAVPVCVE